jgi:K+-transporting ATPase ATPase A chain
MLIGRFFIIIPVMALAGSMASKKLLPPNAGTFPVTGFTFGVLLIGTIIIVGALTFLPALALGPIVEHFIMHDMSGAVGY